MQIDVRRANQDDAEAVASVYLRSRKELVDFAPLARSDAEVRRWIQAALIPSRGVTVAAVDSSIVGFVAISRDLAAGWVDHLYVLPESIGCGIGSRLLTGAREQLGPPVRLYVFQANQRAKAFYECHGFRAIAFGDGSGNEERCPDILYEWDEFRSRLSTSPQ